MSARPEQADLEAAIRAADEAATPGTALLVLGSALSWHQQLWAPLWTERPLFYDNWLWYWHPDHAGTPGYAFLAGHHYPDPERTLERDYLSRHGIGAVVVTGPTREAAATSPLLRPLRQGVYDVYAVIDPVTTVTFGDQNAASLEFGNQRIAAVSDSSGAPVIARVNWYPRWEATVDSERAEARPFARWIHRHRTERTGITGRVGLLSAAARLGRTRALADRSGGGLRDSSSEMAGKILEGHWYSQLVGGEDRFARDRCREVMQKAAGVAGTEHGVG